MAFRPVPVSTPAGVRVSIRHDLVVEARAPVTRVIFALLLLAGLVVGTDLALRVGFLPRRSSNALWTERQALPASDVGTLAPDWVRIARTLRPAVVHIGAWEVDAGKPIYLGLGSGLIINPDGYIVTNQHVIERAAELRVKLADGRELIATVVGQDHTMDLALLKIEARDLPVIPLGDSSALQVGEPVMAIGSPFGFDQTATVGIVSALDREVELKPNDRFIQTDANINPGNSGGPLINRRGQAIGINTVVFTKGGGNTGISFAIPTRFAEPILTRLAAEHGTGQTAPQR
jgi:S1-C subfamily serine protease